jgi:hypothetical protein
VERRPTRGKTDICKKKARGSTSPTIRRDRECTFRGHFCQMGRDRELTQPHLSQLRCDPSQLSKRVIVQCSVTSGSSGTLSAAGLAFIV